MKKLIKPACLLLYLLSLLVFFLLGASAAGLAGAAEGQGLAGAAIVIGYGIMAGLAALVAALFVAYYATRRAILLANRVLGVVFLVLVVVFTYRYYTR